MPKTKVQPKTDELEGEEKILNPDLLAGDEGVELMESEEETADEDEVDPYKDRWEE